MNCIVYERHKAKQKGCEKISISCETAIELYSDMVYRIAVSQVLNVQDAEDVFQDVFVQLVKHIDSLDTQEHVKHWLIRTTINRSKNVFASFWRKNVTLLSQDDFQPDNSVAGDNSNSDIFLLVSTLPKKLRSVTYLHYYEGYTVEETAKIVGIKSGTVKSRLYKARSVLKDQLEKE